MTKKSIDRVGEWTEVKLQIIQEYASAYSRIMAKQPFIKHYAYIDGFAGSGSHILRATGEEIYGSPAIALKTIPPFPYYHFIDLDGTKADCLRSLTKGRADVSVYEQDCNTVLLERIFPDFRFETFRRALCLLDPYDLNPHWEVIRTAGGMQTIEIFLNFMISDANRNVFLWNSLEASPSQIKRMNLFWGDESWREVVYTQKRGLFGDINEKAPNEVIAKAFQKRLIEVAKFQYVPDPIPLRNSKGVVLYYLFFASPNKTGDKVIRDIFNKYREQGVIYGS
jgi:three-Cys-motif partner protein